MQILRVMLLIANFVASIAFLSAAVWSREHNPVQFAIAAGFILNFAYILTAPPGRFE
jgi:hypothetical protein